MANERNLGVTEASIGLSVLICLLVSFGYVLVQRLGGSAPLEVEVLTDQPDHENAGIAREVTPLGGMIVEYSSEDDYEVPQTALRPQWLAPRDDARSHTEPDNELRLSFPLEGFQPDFVEPNPNEVLESSDPLIR